MSQVITKEEEKVEGDKHVAFKLLAPLGENKEGEVVHLPEEVGMKLVECGIAALASADDMGGEVDDDADQMDDAPMVANAAAKLTKQVEKVAADVVSKTLQNKKVVNSVPVEIKQPIYRSNGSYIRGIIKATLDGDKTEWNKVRAYEQEAARAWNKLGVQTKASLGVNEGTNSQGGYLVNPQFSPDVFAIPHGQIDLQSMCPTIEAQSNLYHQRFVNESSLANGSIFGGLNMVATTEGNSFTSSLPAWSDVTLTLQKLAIFVYYTTELLQDASYPVESELDEYVKKAFVYGINTQIIQGTTLEGALNAPSLVTVTHSSNDTAWHTTSSTNLTYADLASIWASVYPDCQTSPKGVWLFHPSHALTLSQMTYTFSGSSPAWGIQYDAQQGLNGRGPGVDGGTPYSIFGKPAYPCWACSAPGNAGDIMYVDFNTFRLYRKPFRVEVSKEFQFGTDQVAVRFVSRLDCKTIFRSTVTGVNGSQSFGPIVTRSGGLT